MDQTSIKEIPMNEITLKFTTDEVGMLLAALSALPTGSGAWPLAIRIKTDAEAQFVPAETTQ
jgi:hypothetical protein